MCKAFKSFGFRRTVAAVRARPIRKKHCSHHAYSRCSAAEKGASRLRRPSAASDARPHPPDQRSEDRLVPFHSHSAQWELFVIISGTGTVRANQSRFKVKAGDVIMHPPGEAHQIINTGRRDLVFYLIADNPPVDGCHYPDSKKWGSRRPRKFFRMTEVDYWDGEE